MKAYSLRLLPKSSWASPWHADTLFGSLAWTWRYVHGVSHLEDLLELYREGRPPFVVSDVFPGDLLPFPAGASAPESTEKKKAVWVSRETFLKFASGTSGSLEIALDGANPFLPWTRLQNSLSRITDSTDEGQLFEVDMMYLDRKASFSHLSLYLRCEDEWVAPLEQVLEVFSSRGFGRRASTGLGAFSVEGTLRPCQWLEPADDSNGFMAMGHFLPAAGDPVDGSWRLHVTHPKFYSANVSQFLKGSFLMLTPGSVFRTHGKPLPWYGRTCSLQNAEMPKAVQYGMVLAAPVRLPSTWISGNGD